MFCLRCIGQVCQDFSGKDIQTLLNHNGTKWHEALHLGGSAIAAAQSLLVLLKCAMEWLDSPVLHLPQLISSGRNQVLVMTDHQHPALKSRQALQSKWECVTIGD